MARIKIEFPENIIARLTIPVRITDINYGNHVGNDALVGIIHESRVQWLKKNNYTELDIDGMGLIMSDLAVEYINESFYGDLLEITIASAGLTKLSFELYYQVQTNRNDQTILIAKAKTGMVCYDYANKKVATMPEGLKRLMV
jgi:acyl-CoA thioesterase FadM